MLNFIPTAALLTLIIASTGQAADMDTGKSLVEKNCVRCHGSEVYTRNDRRITTLPGLHKQVRRCEQMLDLTWFDEDIDNVAGYLNHQYYKFGETP
jgi:cytochrome c553